jgi:hypothetical protein
MAGSAKRDVSDPRAAKNGASKSTSPPLAPGLDRVIQAQIGTKLRAMYGELTDQPVPDRLTAIIDRLARSGPGGGT